MEIVAFVRARLDDDERIAAGCEHQQWELDGSIIPKGGSGYEQVVDWVYDEDGTSSDHIARHDPARVLREVEAKRRMLEWAQAQLDDFEDFPDEHQYRLDAIGVIRLHLPLLALPYSDHPDYREEWRP